MIGDFGHSKTVHNHSKSLTLGRKVGTIGYIAPELINESDFENNLLNLDVKLMFGLSDVFYTKLFV